MAGYRAMWVFERAREVLARMYVSTIWGAGIGFDLGVAGDLLLDLVRLRVNKADNPRLDAAAIRDHHLTNAGVPSHTQAPLPTRTMPTDDVSNRSAGGHPPKPS